LNGKKVCIVGDEAGVSVPGCAYTSGPFTIPGVGTLKVASLGANHTARQTNTGGRPLLLKGSNFIAKFEVQTAAKQPPPGPGGPIPDSARQYTGGPVRHDEQRAEDELGMRTACKAFSADPFSRRRTLA
jgi:hypothetical protein